MTDSFVTQCPNCRTSFRISRAQLGAAHGAVRCGACMHVFNAAQQLLVDQNRASRPATVPPVAPPAASPIAPPAATPPRTPPPVAKPLQPEPRRPVEKQSIDTLWIHDDLDLDSIDLDEELAKLEEQELQLSRELLNLDSAASPAEHLLQAEEEDTRHDESWTESLLRPSPAQTTQTATHPTVAQGAAAAPQPLSRPTPAVPDESQPKGSAPQLGDIDAATSQTAADDAKTTERPDAKPPRNEPDLSEHGLLSLNDSPLQLDWQPPKKPWGRWIGWGLLNLLAAIALLTQYVTYHFAELARQDQYRPWFAAICPEIGCTLPPRVDITQIRSTNLVVRSHPQYMEALLVDAILYNRAPFAQPFPLLELRFADLNGQLIASNRFRPSEYLNGELAGRAEMPPQTPIHIALEIKDPGPRAVNYSLSFHSPD